MKSILIALALLVGAGTAHATTGDICLDRALDAGNKDPAHRQAAYNKAMATCTTQQHDGKDCYVKLVTVCPMHKPKHKKPPVVVVPAPLVEYREKLVVVHRDCPPPTIIYRDRFVPAPAGCPPEGNAVFGAWGAIGLGARDPYVSGNFGGQVRFPKAYLGLRVYSALQYGFGANALLYAYQGPRVRVHVLDPGVFIPIGDSYLSDADIKRHVDITVGAGVEVKLACHLALTADLRTNIPDPGVIAAHETCGAGCRSRIDAGNAIGNSFAATQLLLGALFSF